MKPSLLRQRRNYIIAILILWFTAVCLHAWYYVSSVLAQPEQIPEWYARSVSFQLFAFCYVAMTYWLLILVVALVAVRFVRLKGHPDTEAQQSRER
jgi:hypothetical protein